MAEDDILKTIDRLTPGGDDGDKRCLTNVLDVCLWVEPKDARLQVDNTGNARIFIACENHGYFRAKPCFETCMTKGEDVIRLVGQTKRALYVPPPEPKKRSVNWDHCKAIGVLPSTRDDCLCSWTIKENTNHFHRDTHLKMETADY